MGWRLGWLLALGLGLSGCLSEGGPASTALAGDGWAEFALTSGEGHDHADPAQHAGRSTPNFEVVGFDPLVSPSQGRTAGGHICGDAADAGGRRLAVTQGYGTGVVFILADVTDAAAPFVLGELVLPLVGVRDVALTADGRYVAFGTEDIPTSTDVVAALAAPDGFGAGLRWRDACSGLERPVAGADLVYPNGVVLVDVGDPTSPVVESYFPLPAFGAHSITAGMAGGRQLVVASAVNHLQATSYYQFLEVTETPAGAQLALRGTWMQAPDPERPDATMGHTDAWVFDHPRTGMPMAAAAHYSGGIVFLDLSDVGVPREVGRWVEDRGMPTNNKFHEAIPLEELWDGRHYTIVGPELQTHPEDVPSGRITILDTTDPAQPEPVATWTLPAEVEWEDRFMFSNHYLDVHGRTIFVTMYHGGIWAVDARDLSGPRLPAVGVFLPDRYGSDSAPLEGTFPWFPVSTEVVALPGGDLVTWEQRSGLYVLRYDEASPMPPAWPLDPSG